MSNSELAPPRVRVLLAAYNGERFIQAQIDSVLRQVGVQVDLLVSDGGSSDGTVDVVRAIAAADPRVRLADERDGERYARRLGSAAANFLFLVSTLTEDGAAFVAFCDQDDLWDTDKLAVACRVLERTGADLYSSSTLAVWGDGRTRTLVQAPRTTAVDFLFEGAGQGCTFVGRGALFARVREWLVRETDLVAGIHYHDWLVYALMRSWGGQWVFDPHPHMRYMQHQGNDTGARSGQAGVGHRLARIRSGWYARQVRAMLRVCLAVNPEAPELLRTRALMDGADESVFARWRWCAFLLGRSRRRRVDRIVLSMSAACGLL